MTEQRPRPQYGEYATPQVQAEAMGLPSAVPPPSVLAERPVAVRRPGQANRIVTLMLLALGLVNVVLSAGNYLDLPGSIQTVYDQMGLGTYTSTALASSLGVVALVLSLVIWLTTAAVSALLLRRHRLSWWVPVVGAALLFIAIAIVMTVAVISDPAFLTYVQKSA
jgi:hypothetical protein